MPTLEADYLIVGSGAMGMAFADTLFHESNATMVIVDRYHQPGGHWNVAYPHVRLHQPSAFYGVNSRALGNDTIDASGWNKGLYELATNGEVCAYFDQVMQQQLLPSGRVRYYPMCEHDGDGAFHSLVSGAKYKVNARHIVDATYMKVTVPSMRAPGFQVDEGAYCVPPNALSRVRGEYTDYVVVGAGKTGMDACLFLLKAGVAPAHIRWIMPRDSWMLDRAHIQPGSLFANNIANLFTRQAADMAAATSLEDLFARVEASGQLLRLDPNITPTMYRCATVTQAELEQLKRIDQVVRLGRVKRIGTTSVALDNGEIETSAATLHIDCTADGLATRPALPVFNGANITLQSVRTCQQVFSAAFIAHVATAYEDEDERNALCTPVPHPDTALDFVRTSLQNMTNAGRWGQDADLQAWLKAARLDGFSSPGAPDPDPATAAEMGEATARAVENLQRLLDEA